MINEIKNIPVSLLLIILLSGLAIFIFFKLLDKYFIVFFNKKRIQAYYSNIAVRLKLLFWIIWFAISVYFLLLASPLITLVFLVGGYLFSKDLWSNIYSGFFIMNKVKVGEYISIRGIGIAGIVNKFHLIDVELKKDDYEVIVVPYSAIINSTIVKKDVSGNNYLNEFVLDDISTEISDKKLKDAILKNPWTILNKPYEVDVNHPKGVFFRIYTFSKETADEQREYVHNVLSGE